MLQKRGIVTILALLLVLASCQSNGNQNEAKATFTGTIVEINNQSAIVAIETGEILRSGDKVTVALSKNRDVDFQAGDKVKVGYDGIVQESYPLGINVIYVELID